MDLSQQELPLTSYFTRGSKEAKSRAVPYKKGKLAEDPQSVAHPSKRRKSNVQCSTASLSGSSVGQSNSRLTTLQLPTPATSTRKCTRNGRLELPAKTPLTSTGAVLSSVEPNASEEDLSQLESGSIPSKLPKSSRKGPILESVPLATPLTGRRRTAKFIGEEFTPLSNHGEAGIPTPQTLSRRTSEPVDGNDDRSPLARNCHLPSKPSQASPRTPDSGISHAVLPRTQHSARSTAGLPCFPSPVDFDDPDPFYAREKNNVSVQQDGAFAPPKQYSIQSKTLDGQPSNGHVIPMLPVPSSQSQYLLHPDATPKRKRSSRRIEHVISSQTQEERELTLSTPRKPTAMVGLSVGVSPGKYTRGNPQIPGLDCSKRNSQHVYTYGSTPVGPPINSPAGRSLFATKKASDELESKCSSPSRGERLTPCHSPSRKAKTPQRSPCHGSIENIPPAHIEESLTESESESDILQMKMKIKMKDKLSTVDLPSREMNEITRHSPVARDACIPARCGFAEGDPPLAEDDSATEAESDTEILHCVAAIGNKRPRGHRSQVSREDPPPPPVISPLVSPARSRIAAMPSIISFTQFPTQEGPGSSIPGSCPSYPSAMEQPQIPSQSLPSVVRDFLRMFPGDESYPADFPESLRA
ncbi:hypothetical protein OG21DRAFT_979626 [Imleria badia]|nr:hypothetical protein OG21DRAFT_979626 [Imleria badia]